MTRITIATSALLLTIFGLACSQPSPSPADAAGQDTPGADTREVSDMGDDTETNQDTAATNQDSSDGSTSGRVVADVTDVTVSGEPGNYRFSVTIESPDTGCEQYADWWEVVDRDGDLVYRRILAHSHTDEQPFTRSGGPVDVAADELVYVRAHMNTGGYGGRAVRFTPNSEPEEADVSSDFAAGLESVAPQPDGCAF